MLHTGFVEKRLRGVGDQRLIVVLSATPWCSWSMQLYFCQYFPVEAPYSSMPCLVRLSLILFLKAQQTLLLHQRYFKLLVGWWKPATKQPT